MRERSHLEVVPSPTVARNLSLRSLNGLGSGGGRWSLGLLLKLLIGRDLDLHATVLRAAGFVGVGRHRLVVGVALRGQAGARDALRFQEGDDRVGAG